MPSPISRSLAVIGVGHVRIEATFRCMSLSDVDGLERRMQNLKRRWVALPSLPTSPHFDRGAESSPASSAPKAHSHWTPAAILCWYAVSSFNCTHRGQHVFHVGMTMVADHTKIPHRRQKRCSARQGTSALKLTNQLFIQPSKRYAR